MPDSKETAMGSPASTWELATALPCALCAAGARAAFDDVLALLGLAPMACAPIEQQPLGIWPTFARDAFLVPGGRDLGLGIRELHPPEAARGLEAAEGFEQHFDASYRPLIHRALDNGQQVLAWATQPESAVPIWLLIREACVSGAGFLGEVFVPSDQGSDQMSSRSFVLGSPPTQVYIIEETSDDCLAEAERLQRALERARAVHANEVGVAFQVTSGVASYDVWASSLRTLWLRDGPAQAIAAHRELAAAVRLSHLSMVRFLEAQGRFAGVLDEALLVTVTEAYKLIAAALTFPANIGAAETNNAEEPVLESLCRHLADTRAATHTALTALTARRRRPW